MCYTVFFNDTATTEIYTLSLHDALPIWQRPRERTLPVAVNAADPVLRAWQDRSELLAHAWPDSPPRTARDLLRDRKSTRLNSSHANISYAVFCLKKNNKITALVWPHTHF